MWMVHQLAEEPENVWWDDTRTADITETRDEILIRSFREAVDRIKAERGADRSQWQWGTMHTATFVSNPLGLSGIDLIEQMVNRGPVAAAGGSAIVNATNWNFSNSDSFELSSLPSMRFIADLSDLRSERSERQPDDAYHRAKWASIQPALWGYDRPLALDSIPSAVVDAGAGGSSPGRPSDFAPGQWVMLAEETKMGVLIGRGKPHLSRQIRRVS